MEKRYVSLANTCSIKKIDKDYSLEEIERIGSDVKSAVNIFNCFMEEECRNAMLNGNEIDEDLFEFTLIFNPLFDKDYIKSENHPLIEEPTVVAKNVLKDYYLITIISPFHGKNLWYFPTIKLIQNPEKFLNGLRDDGYNVLEHYFGGTVGREEAFVKFTDSVRFNEGLIFFDTFFGADVKLFNSRILSQKFYDFEHKDTVHINFGKLKRLSPYVEVKKRIE